jgi:hypothetical protein
LVCSVYDVDDIQFDNHTPAQPLVTTLGMHSVFLPVLFVSKEARLMIECVLDPLVRGAKIDNREPVSWKFKVWSASGVLVSGDRTQQDEFALIKNHWEKTKPGRSKQAKVRRESWLEERRTLETLEKQPIVTEPILHPGVQLNEDLLKDQAYVRGQRLRRAAVHKEALIRTRESEREQGQELLEAREMELKATKETSESDAAREWEERKAYRRILLEHQDLMHTLMMCVTHPFMMADDVGKSRRGQKGDFENATDTATGVKAYVTNIFKALDTLGGIPTWKVEHLVKAAVARVQEVTVLSIKIPISQAEASAELAGEKKADRDRLLYVNQIKIAISLAKALEPQYVSTVVLNEIERAEKFLLSDSIRELSVELQQEPVDLSVVSTLQQSIDSRMGRMIGCELDPDEVEVLNIARSLLAGYAQSEKLSETTENRTGKKVSKTNKSKKTKTNRNSKKQKG